MVAPAQAVSGERQIEAEVSAWTLSMPPNYWSDTAKRNRGSCNWSRSGSDLGLQTFLTAGPTESRAWTIHIGDTAPRQRGRSHRLRARIHQGGDRWYDDLVEAGSVAAVRAAGKARIEGKDYKMRDGDVVEFRFNV